MNCTSRNQERFASLLSGELNSVSAFLLRRHLSGCKTCRDECANMTRLRHDLASLAAAEANPVLGFLRQLPLEQPGLQEFIDKGARMKKRLIIAGFATAAVVITASVAAQKLTFRPYGQVGDWKISSGFRGTIQCYDTDKHLQGTFGDDTGDPVNGDVDVNIDSHLYHFLGPGRHEVRDPLGKLMGYVVMTAPSKQEMATEDARFKAMSSADWDATVTKMEALPDSGDVDGITSWPTGVAGGNSKLGVTWKMIGAGSVKSTSEDANSKVKCNASNGTPPPEYLARFSPQMRAHILAVQNSTNPVFTITVHGDVQTEEGYGEHRIYDNTGKLLMILKASPPSDSRQP